MAKKDSRFSFARSIQVFQENVSRAGPAATASYSLDRRHRPAGWAGLRGRPLARFGAVGCVWRPHARPGGRVLRVGESGSASMKPVAWMAAASGAAWLLVTRLAGGPCQPGSALWGIAGPLASACVSWMAYVRAHEAAPERLTRVMITAFALKLMFFGVYVAGTMRRARLAAGAVRGEFYECLHRAARDGGLQFAAPGDGACVAKSRAHVDTTRCFSPSTSSRRPAPRKPPSKFNPGEMIIEHVSNSSLDHPLIHLPKVFGIDFSVTKHVLMLWIVAAIVFFVVTVTVRRYLRQDRQRPVRLHERARVPGRLPARQHRRAERRQEVGQHLHAAAPHVLSVHPDGESDRHHPDLRRARRSSITRVIHAPEESFFARVLHGGVTATGNYNVTAALATITFFTIIIAGSRRTASFSTGRTWCRTVCRWP